MTHQRPNRSNSTIALHLRTAGIGAVLLAALLACGGKNKCAQNTDCKGGQVCQAEQCVAAQAVQSPTSLATTPPQPPAATPAPVPTQPVTVTAGGLGIGTHGCVLIDSTGSYNRACKVEQSGTTVKLRAPGTRLNPRIGYKGVITGGPSSYQYSGSVKGFRCSGDFKTTLALESIGGTQWYVGKATPGCGGTKFMIRKATL